jgi:site-specific DNA-methyltransferase (adenine-specific)
MRVKRVASQRVRVIQGNCLTEVPRLVAEGVVVDSIVCDPPYHLRFMGKTWDGGNIAFRPETWATFASVLRPGGFLLAFGGSRTWHRLACAIEDAGFVIQDTLMWLYGTGFPKRKDMLKPAFEPLIMAYKPGGARTLQVDECRIPTDDQVKPRGSCKLDTDMNEGWARPWMEDRGVVQQRHDDAIERANTLGRWPANVCHDGSDEVMEAFAAFGERSSGGGDKRGSHALFGSPDRRTEPTGHKPNTGSAARFFYCAKADAQDRWGSRHPTVKPVELMKWLVPLVTPKAPAIVLDPFAGSGTTGVAALATGRNAILIERDETYCADIRERIAHYEGSGRHSLVSRNRNKRAGVGALRDGGRLEADADRRDKGRPLFAAE